jgi:hypothetical protein
MNTPQISPITTPSLPNLVIVGAMKCGTSSLHEYLNLHPEIFMSAVKEIDYFSGNNSNQPLNWYTSQFDGSYKIRGESSQNYSKSHNPFHSGAPEAMARVIPDAKLIYIMRDPIERYRSHIVENYLGESAEEIALNLKLDTYVETGLYHKQIQVFLEHFPLEQIFFVDLDSLQKSRLYTLNQIFDFLGVSQMQDPTTFAFRKNENGEDVLPPNLRNRRVVRLLNRLAPGMLNRITNHPTIRSRLFPGSLKAKLSDDELARLRLRFAEDVANLRTLTGLPLKGWSV